MNKDKNQFTYKISKLIPEEHRILMIETLLGTSGILTQFIINNLKIKTLPDEIKYACALTANNILNLISDKEKIDFENMSEKSFEMSEQIQESIYRRMKYVVEELYKNFQENDL